LVTDDPALVGAEHVFCFAVRQNLKLLWKLLDADRLIALPQP